MQNVGFRKLPKVQDYLLDVLIYDQLDEIVEKYKFPESRLGELLDLTDAVIDNKIELNQISGFISKAFGLDDEKTKMIASDVIGYRLLPLSEFISGVENQIKELGGSVSDYPKLRVAKPKIEEELLEYAKEIGLELPENLMKRFIYLSKGYLKKERDREATVIIMKRPMNIGGLELKLVQIKQLLEILDKRFGESNKLQKNELEIKVPVLENQKKRNEAVEISSVSKINTLKKPELPKGNIRIKSNPKKTIRNRQTLPIKAISHALTTKVPVISGRLLKHEEDEVKSHKDNLKKNGFSGSRELSKELLSVINDAVEVIYPIFKIAKQSQKSAKAVAESFIRGRLNEHRADILLQDKYKMSDKASYEVIAILKKSYTEFHKDNKQKVVVEQNNNKKNNHSLNDRHAELTLSVSKELIEPIMPSARVSASRSKEEESVIQSKKIDKDKVKKAQRKSRPVRADVRLSKQSAPPKVETEISRKVSDIRRVSRLIGPIEELGTMGIAEFRRLSSDPQEAISKILNTLDLLEGNDYEERIKGIKAFRDSPLSTLYISLVQRALTDGVSIADTAMQKRNAGEESLSSAEIDSIVELNKSISF